MCGIAGVVDYRVPPDPALAQLMGQVLRHRGPDEVGYYTDEVCALTVRRLSVQDVLHGHQPAYSEDGRIAVMLNGEVYNFREIRRELEKRGHRFRSNSDTEVLPHLYEERGDDFVQALRGMFSIAVWDANRRRLLLVRDRLGKKPLFYTKHRGSFRFASEIKALLAERSVPREPNLEALHFYLCLQYVPAPWTAFVGISAVPAAHRMIVDKEGIRVERYWSLNPKVEASINRREAAERVAFALRDAVRLRMIADVPLGAFLSGGIDSSCVVAAMAEVSSAPVRTFTIGFEESDQDERESARSVAKVLGTIHAEELVRPNVAGLLPVIAWHFDQPLADHASIPTFIVAREARKHVTVALNGDGGDEAFGGYPRIRRLAFRGPDSAARRAASRVLRMLPMQADPMSVLSRLERVGLRQTATLKDAFCALTEVFPETSLRNAYTSEMAEATKDTSCWKWLQRAIPDDGDSLWKAQAADYSTYLPGALLPKVDIASMAVSLEVRSPMLDHRFVELAASLPSNTKVGSDGSKQVLRDAFRGILPDEILDGPKRGFGLPLAHWFRGDLAPFVRGLIDSEHSLVARYLRREAISQLLWSHRRGVGQGVRIFALVMLELWLQTYIESPPPLEPPSELEVSDLS